MNTNTFDKPSPVTTLSMTFGDINGIMPPYESIPAEFKNSRNKWAEVQSEWFYRGLGGAEFIPQEGIDANEALRHLQTIQGSFAPKHEHKQAAVAWLMSKWFKDIIPASKKKEEA